MTSNDQPLRILHLASSERWTGAAEPSAMLALEQLRQGHQVEYACIAGSSFERRLGELGVPMAPGFVFDRHLRLKHLVNDIRRLRQYVASNAPDVIHCHLPHDNWIAALALRRPFSHFLKPRPVIIRTMHRDATPHHDITHRWLAGKGTDMVISVSQAHRQAMIDVVGLPSYKVKWVRGAVDLEKFKPGLPPSHIREIYNIPAEAHVAGMVARMQPHRGHHAFIDTVEEVLKADPLAFYALAGRGELKDEIVARIRDHKLSGHMRRIGYRKHDLPETYAAMDVVLMLVPGSDGTCRAMLEAMACGRPVIGSRRGAIADTIQHGMNGWLIEPGSREELTLALIEALCNLDATRAMGDAARKYVEEFHNREAQYKATLEVYQEALDRRAGVKK
jgi:glycosyltransferase involved in cell wall biosynthesis